MLRVSGVLRKPYCRLQEFRYSVIRKWLSDLRRKILPSLPVLVYCLKARSQRLSETSIFVYQFCALKMDETTIFQMFDVA